MQMKLYRILFTVLFGTALCLGTLAAMTNNVHAASQNESHVAHIAGQSIPQNATHSSNEKTASQKAHTLAPHGCDLSKITYHSYWWGDEWYLPPCVAAMAAAGTAVIPVVGTIGAAAIGVAIAASCNGSIYIDQPILTGGPAYPRAAC